MILETEKPLLGLRLQIRMSQLNLINQYAVQGNRNFTGKALDLHTVPLACRLGGVGFGVDTRQNATASSMCTDLGLAGRVYNLYLNDRADSLFAIGDVEIEATVSPFFMFVLELDLKVLVRDFAPQVMAIACPASLPGSWSQDKGTYVIDLPIPGGFPIGQRCQFSSRGTGLGGLVKHVGEQVIHFVR